MRHHIRVVAWSFFITLALLLGFWMVTAFAQSACSYYAAPNGSGSACTQQAPCKVGNFWFLAAPGSVLCLKDGTYRGSDSMITPPSGLRGTKDKPIIIRAEHDGKVLLDAQQGGSAVSLAWHGSAQASNNWFIVEGINAANGREHVYMITGSDNIVRRVIGWNGTSGENPYVFYIAGYRSRAEDCAGWGMNIRKVMNGSQAGNLQGAGFRRCWAEWNDHPQGSSNPSNTYQLGYNTTNQLFENVIGTWDTKGQESESQGALHMFYSNDPVPNDMQGSKVLGSIFYAASGQRYTPGTLVAGTGLSGMTLQDIAAIAAPEHTHVAPFWFGTWPCGGNASCRNTNNICANCLAVHAGTPVYNEPGAGWTLPGLRQGQGLQAATGGESAFNLLPGICKRYINGEITQEPLWPWPMNQRIKDARAVSEFPLVDVTATIESLLGPIPAACKGSMTPPEPPTATTQLSCTGLLGEGGAVAIACVPQEGKK